MSGICPHPVVVRGGVVSATSENGDRVRCFSRGCAKTRSRGLVKLGAARYGSLEFGEQIGFESGEVEKEGSGCLRGS